MRLDLFDYELPQELIAVRPAPERDRARMLVIGPGGALADRTIADLVSVLPRGALVVANDTRVVPARLLGRKASTGGQAEVFLVARAEDQGREVEALRARGVPAERWRALGKASKPWRFPVDVTVGEGGELDVCVVGKFADGLLDVILTSPAGLPIDNALARWGHVPLPPYLRRADDADDRDRYQTVFARTPGAVAAPTAGLHFTPSLLARLAARDVRFATVTLHVGLGTFQPVTVDDFDAHPMHEEQIEVSVATSQAIAEARKRGAPVVAIGTTVVRALESAADHDVAGLVTPFAGPTRLLIQPGYPFRVVDQLLTNFHLPRSTLLSLVAAFAGRGHVLRAYNHAVREKYRFYSYGDAMLLTSRVDPSAAAS